MSDATTRLECRCGAVQMEVWGKPITVSECCCTSCRDAAGRIATLSGAPQVLTAHRTTPFVLQRKDRFRLLSGAEHLAEFRLTPKSSTRRVVATCCNTPVFLEFQAGHWLSLYSGLWPAGSRPAPELRTMASDLPAGATLPKDIPNMKTQGGAFMLKLLGAWIGMGLRSPKIAVARRLEL